MHNSTALPPAPGSAAALALGCKCPVIDNGHGRGFRGIPDVFVYSGACELHNAQFGLAEAEIEKGQSNAQG